MTVQPTSTNILVTVFSIVKVILYQFIMIHLTILFDHRHSGKSLYFLLIQMECTDKYILYSICNFLMACIFKLLNTFVFILV